MKDEAFGARSLYWHYPHYGNQGGDPVPSSEKETEIDPLF